MKRLHPLFFSVVFIAICSTGMAQKQNPELYKQTRELADLMINYDALYWTSWGR